MTTLAQAFHDIVTRRRSVRIYDQEAPFDSEAVTRSLQRAHLAPNSSNLQLWEFYHVKDPVKKTELAEYCLAQPAATTARELVVIVTRKDLWPKRVDFMLRIVKKGFEREDANEKAVPKAKKTKDTGNVLQGMANDAEARRKGVLQYYGKLIPQLYKGDRFGIMGRLKKIYVNLFMAPKKPAYREVGYSDTRIIAHKSAALAAQTFMLSMAAEGYDTCPMEGIDTVRIRKFLKLPKGAEINMVIACGPGKQEGVYGPRVRLAEQKVIFEI